MTFEPPSALAFADALQARLGALPTIEAYILTTVPERPSTGYVWAQVGGVDEYRDRMTGLASDAGGSVVLHCCGFTPEQALLTDDLVRTALQDWRWAADPSVSPLRNTQTSEIVKDDSVKTDIRFSVTRIYRYDA